MWYIYTDCEIRFIDEIDRQTDQLAHQDIQTDDNDRQTDR